MVEKATETLKESLFLLMEARENLAKLKTQKEAAYQQWLKDNAHLMQEIEGAILEVNEHELYIRDVALSSYKINQDKHPCPGVEIKEYLRKEVSAENIYDIQMQIATDLEKVLQ